MIFGDPIPTLRELSGMLKKLPDPEETINDTMITTDTKTGAELTFSKMVVETEDNKKVYLWIYRGAVAVTEKVL